MATSTATGLPVPTLGDDPNVPRDMLALAVLLDGVTRPRFASTAVRDAAFPVPSPGLMCTIGDSIWFCNSSSAWVEHPVTVPAYFEATGSTPVITSTAVWIFLGTPTLGMQSGAGWSMDNFSGNINPMPAASMWDIEAKVTWGANASGRRLIAVTGSAFTVPGANVDQTNTMPSASGTGSLYQQARFYFPSPAAGQRVALWALQDSGNQITITNRRILARRVV